ncbi:LacI family DNA-binding transcriptional regulator [Cytobacillus oceanisediminis]|uniref:LacI family DNA-binding transcriptional regulator n=1 Tax=Cytobacillus oceanisediminis TaxID=665099 RepID=UPI003736CB3E
MTTIKDVAKHANVSIATVSAVINKTKFVSEELKERVETAIEELNYRPNKVARSLKRKESKLIGVTVTEITNPFYPLMLKGVDDIALGSGYNVILCTTGDDPEKELEMLQSMVDQGVDGIIFATIDNEDSTSVQLLKKEGIPHVLINRAPADYEGSQVRIDSYKVGKMATNYLINLGHTDIAFLGGDRLNSKERESGYKDALLENGLSLNENRIIKSDYQIETAYRDMNSLIATGDVPTAIFTASDIMAFGAIKALIDSGFNVPNDVSVIGSDNISFSEDFRIPLTTVDAHTYEIGRMGCEILLRMLANKEQPEHRRLLLEPKLVIRESTSIKNKRIGEDK